MAVSHEFLSGICREFGKEIASMRQYADDDNSVTHVDRLVETADRTKKPADWMHITEVVISDYKSFYLNNPEILHMCIYVKANNDWRRRVHWKREDVIKNTTYTPAVFYLKKDLYQSIGDITLRPIYIEGISELESTEFLH